MDKALVFGTKDCRFESYPGHALVFGYMRHARTAGIFEFRKRASAA